jgi:DNA transposition AAA+ family ATPase
LREQKPQSSEVDTVKRLRQREMIIVDEADRRQMNGLEEIRDFYDRFDVAVAFLGLPGIEKPLISFVHEMI